MSQQRSWQRNSMTESRGDVACIAKVYTYLVCTCLKHTKYHTFDGRIKTTREQHWSITHVAQLKLFFRIEIDSNETQQNGAQSTFHVACRGSVRLVGCLPSEKKNQIKNSTRRMSNSDISFVPLRHNRGSIHYSLTSGAYSQSSPQTQKHLLLYNKIG